MTSQPSSSGQQFEHTVVGNGKDATGLGQTAIAHDTGRLSDGTQFDSSKGGSQAFCFPIAYGRVIEGRDEVIISMQEGGTRRLTIPHELAYGSAGAGHVLTTPHSFEIEHIEVSE